MGAAQRLGVGSPVASEIKDPLSPRSAKRPSLWSLPCVGFSRWSGFLHNPKNIQ